MLKRVEALLAEANMLEDGDLAYLIANLNKEQADREQKQRKRDWEAVRFAIVTYIENWGNISVSDDEHTLDIDKHSDFGSMGEIDTAYY